MKYFLDTEFEEKAKNGKASIELISIGIVSESGDELYFENKDFNWDRKNIDPWLVENVLPTIGNHLYSIKDIKTELLNYFNKDMSPEFWAYYADYDWVVFCSIFGKMIELPNHFPMYCMDLKQVIKTYRLNKVELPKQISIEHNALNDALWNKEVYQYLVTRNFV